MKFSFKLEDDVIIALLAFGISVFK